MNLFMSGGSWFPLSGLSLSLSIALVLSLLFSWSTQAIKETLSSFTRSPGPSCPVGCLDRLTFRFDSSQWRAGEVTDHFRTQRGIHLQLISHYAIFLKCFHISPSLSPFKMFSSFVFYFLLSLLQQLPHQDWQWMPWSLHTQAWSTVKENPHLKLPWKLSYMSNVLLV